MWGGGGGDTNGGDCGDTEGLQAHRVISLSEVDVGKKICNLRTYYIREMLKRDKAILRGQTSAESYLPRWPYFDALDAFLQDVVRKKRNEYLTVS